MTSEISVLIDSSVTALRIETPLSAASPQIREFVKQMLDATHIMPPRGVYLEIVRVRVKSV